MVRAILGVIVGYVVMALLVFSALTVADLAMGANAAFNAGTFEVSLMWIVISFVLSLIAALIGGYTCALISRGRTAPQVLAGLVFVLGLILAIPAVKGKDTRPNVRSGDVPNMQAMQNARTPTWVALINPIPGAAGVLIGSSLRRRSNAISAGQ